EPRRSSHVCGPGCSHGGGSKGFSVVAEKPAMKTFPAKRPWMFSH
ncbi:MAG TPA: zinc ribbon domain-containing protein, partial [Tistrella mobilis]|nr:zinc ribbon domain-containing protein [Tistrella mobilis]